MPRIHTWDKPLFFISLILLGTGMVLFASAAIGFVGDSTHSPFSLLFRQMILGAGLGSILFTAGLLIPYRFWQKASPFLLFVSFIFLIALFIRPFGITAGGATRWLSFGTFSFQPAEPFKLAFLMYLASWLTSHRKDIATFRHGLFPFLVMLGLISILFILQPNIGTLIIILGTAGLLFFIGGATGKQIIAICLVGFIFLSLLVFFAPYRLERIRVFFHPHQDIQDSGYQLHQALIAIGSGGITGRGFGQSIQKFNYLPEPAGDAIFAVVGEEFGFIGTTALLFLFLLFLWRSTYVLVRISDPFARLLGTGIVILIVFQSFVNIAAFIGILPITGIPLVFLSQGGSSLAFTLAGIGILLNISKYAQT